MDIVVSYVHMNLLELVGCMWHLKGILVFGTYMTITCFLSHDADDAISDTIALVMLMIVFLFQC